MGLTDFSVKLVSKVIDSSPNIRTVCELGDQNLYTSDGRYGKYASEFYIDKKLIYVCIDLNGGNGAMRLDLSKPINTPLTFDLVTDFGVSEHIGKDGVFDWEAIYNCWKNKHKLLKVGGIMINENPLTANWPLHGFNYYTQEFYKELAGITHYTILEIGLTPAMGNEKDGWNVYCVLEKTSELFPTFNQFKMLSINRS